ncbi:hypothetical protein P9Z80_24135 [Bacillus cereus]|nr:hypothetical protein [Bacillus cereus]MEC3260701.1 hypothetical protein [Bacillus cereus]
MDIKLDFNMGLKNELSHKDTCAIAKCLGDFGSMNDYLNFENNSIIFKMTKNEDQRYLLKLISCLERYVLVSDVMKIGSIEVGTEGDLMNVFAFKGRIFTCIEDIVNRKLTVFDVKGNEYTYNMKESVNVPLENQIAVTYFLQNQK